MLIKSVTVAMQQTLRGFSKKEKWLQDFGVLAGDEIHHWAAKTFNEVASMFPASIRVGVSADERRKDGLEFLIYETFGQVVHRIKRDDLILLKRLLPINMQIIETDFENENYMESQKCGETPDWSNLIEELVSDQKRNTLILKHIERVLNENKRNRILLLNERVFACEEWKYLLQDKGIKVGLMVGGTKNRNELENSIDGLISGKIRIGVATTVADEGLDIPPLTHVFLSCPVHSHPKRLEQMIGRAARTCKGKKVGTAVYFWDSKIFPKKKGDDSEVEEAKKRKSFVKKLSQACKEFEIL